MEKEKTNVEMITDEALEEVEGGLIAELGVAAAMAFGVVAPAAAEMTQPEPIVETEHVVHQRNKADVLPGDVIVPDVNGFKVGYYTTNYAGSRVRSGATTASQILNPGLAQGTVLYFDEIRTGTTDFGSIWGHCADGWVCITDSSMLYCSQNSAQNTKVIGGVQYGDRNYVVLASSLHVRALADVNSQSNGFLHYGDVVYVSNVQQTADGSLWGATQWGWACIQKPGGVVYMSFA